MAIIKPIFSPSVRISENQGFRKCAHFFATAEVSNFFPTVYIVPQYGEKIQILKIFYSQLANEPTSTLSR
jgi:hypothetical protein